MLAQYGGNTDSIGLAGPLFALLIVALTITTILLIRSMVMRIRRVREHYPEGFPDPGPGDGRGTGDGPLDTARDANDT